MFVGNGFYNLQISKCNPCDTIFRFTRDLDDNDKEDGWILKSTELHYYRNSSMITISLSDNQTYISIQNRVIIIPKTLPVTPTNFNPIKLYVLFS